MNRFLLMTLLIGFCGSVATGQDSVRVKSLLFSGNLSWSANKMEYWDNNEMKINRKVMNSLAFNAGFTLKGNYRFLGFLYYYLNRDLADNLPWLPDYALMIVRDTYMPNSMFWGYSGFSSNKFSNSFSETGDALLTGSFNIGYRFKTPAKFVKRIKLDSTSTIRTDIQMNYQPKYYNRDGKLAGGIFDGKPIAVFNFQYVVYKGIHLDFSVRYQIREKIKMPWEPDYSYGFGISNGKLGFINAAAWQFTFTYSNANNKFPWSEYKLKKGFLDGNFTIAYNYRIMHTKKAKARRADYSR